MVHLFLGFPAYREVSKRGGKLCIISNKAQISATRRVFLTGRAVFWGDISGLEAAPNFFAALRVYL